MPTGFEIYNFLGDQTGGQNNCQCCGTKMTSATATFSTHKWTEKEIKERLVELALELATAGFFDRGDIKRQIKHWAGKLKKIQEVKEEFNV